MAVCQATGERSVETSLWKGACKLIKSFSAVTGLLAGLFEPPSVPVANNAKEPARVEVLRDHLPTIIDLDEPIRPSARGNFVHVFSHIRMTYHVHLVNLSGTSPPRILSAEDEMTRIVWVTKSDLHTVNIGTGVKKVWDLLYGKNSWPQAVKG